MKCLVIHTAQLLFLASLIGCSNSKERPYGTVDITPASSDSIETPYVEPGLEKSENKLLEFEIISDNSFVNGFGATNYQQTIAVSNFDSNNPKCWEEISIDAYSKPHSNKGLTAVFYFDGKKNTPSIFGSSLEWEPKYDKNCVAGFWKYPTGQSQLTRYPMQ